MKTFINWLAKEVYLCPALVSIFEALLFIVAIWFCFDGLLFARESLGFSHGFATLLLVASLVLVILISAVHYALSQKGEKLIHDGD